MGENIDEGKGRVKEAAGDLTDDETLKREGKVDRATSSIKDKVDDVADKVKEKIGGRGVPSSEVFLEEAFVPNDDLLGQPGRGFKNVMEAFNTARPVIAARAVGLAQGAINHAMEFVQKYFVPNRSFDLVDIAEDSVGVIAGILFSRWWYIKK